MFFENLERKPKRQVIFVVTTTNIQLTCKMKNVFRRIQSCLLHASGDQLSGNALKRINTLSGLISGMIRKGSSHLPDIGCGIPGNIDARSKTIAAKRFIANKWTGYELHFLPMLVAFLRGVLAYTVNLSMDGLTLVIDGSQMGKDNAALMISLVWRGRGIPICWTVKRGGKGHFKVEDHITVVQKAFEVLQQVIPPDVRVRLLGDGEFDAIELQQLCLSYGWDYVLRTATNTVWYEDGQRFHSRDINLAQGQTTFMIMDLEFTQRRFKYVNFVCWHDYKRHDDPIYLVSNLDDERLVIELYDQRYSIECLFKDLKSTSFNVHKTRLKEPSQVANLLLVAALAFLVLTVLAIQYDQVQWQKKVQRVRNDRKVLSFFTFARRLFDYFVDNDIGFELSFQFSKNSTEFIQLQT